MKDVAVIRDNLHRHLHDPVGRCIGCVRYLDDIVVCVRALNRGDADTGVAAGIIGSADRGTICVYLVSLQFRNVCRRAKIVRSLFGYAERIRRFGPSVVAQAGLKERRPLSHRQNNPGRSIALRGHGENRRVVLRRLASETGEKLDRLCCGGCLIYKYEQIGEGPSARIFELTPGEILSDRTFQDQAPKRMADHHELRLLTVIVRTFGRARHAQESFRHVGARDVGRFIAAIPVG